MKTKYNQLTYNVLNEMPHIAFHGGGKFHQYDLEIEKFQNNYEGFISHVRNTILDKMTGDEEAANSFFGELEENQTFGLMLKRVFVKTFQDFKNDLTNFG